MGDLLLAHIGWIGDHDIKATLLLVHLGKVHPPEEGRVFRVAQKLAAQIIYGQAAGVSRLAQFAQPLSHCLDPALHLVQGLHVSLVGLPLATFTGRLFAEQLGLIAPELGSLGYDQPLGKSGLQLEDAQLAAALFRRLGQGEVGRFLLLQALDDLLRLPVTAHLVQGHDLAEKPLQQAVALTDPVGQVGQGRDIAGGCFEGPVLGKFVVDDQAKPQAKLADLHRWRLDVHPVQAPLYDLLLGVVGIVAPGQSRVAVQSPVQ